MPHPSRFKLILWFYSIALFSMLTYLRSTVSPYPEYFFKNTKYTNTRFSILQHFYNINLNLTQSNISIPTPPVQELIIDDDNVNEEDEHQTERAFLEQHFANQAKNSQKFVATESPILELDIIDDRLSFELSDDDILMGGENGEQIALETLSRDHSKSGKRLRERQKLLENGCGGMTPLDMTLSWNPTRYFVVDYDHRLLACIPPGNDELGWHKYSEFESEKYQLFSAFEKLF